MGHTGLYRLVKKKKSKGIRNLSILPDSNLFGAIGHVDICYQGKVIYGSWAIPSVRLFGTIGDGVLFKVDKETIHRTM